MTNNLGRMENIRAASPFDSPAITPRSTPVAFFNSLAKMCDEAGESVRSDLLAFASSKAKGRSSAITEFTCLMAHYVEDMLGGIEVYSHTHLEDCLGQMTVLSSIIEKVLEEHGTHPMMTIQGATAELVRAAQKLDVAFTSYRCFASLRQEWQAGDERGLGPMHWARVHLMQEGKVDLPLTQASTATYDRPRG